MWNRTYGEFKICRIFRDHLILRIGSHPNPSVKNKYWQRMKSRWNWWTNRIRYVRETCLFRWLHTDAAQRHGELLVSGPDIISSTRPNGTVCLFSVFLRELCICQTLRFQRIVPGAETTKRVSRRVADNLTENVGISLCYKNTKWTRERKHPCLTQCTRRERNEKCFPLVKRIRFHQTKWPTH